jgi:hypothetical protein
MASSNLYNSQQICRNISRFFPAFSWNGKRNKASPKERFRAGKESFAWMRFSSMTLVTAVTLLSQPLREALCKHGGCCCLLSLSRPPSSPKWRHWRRSATKSFFFPLFPPISPPHPSHVEWKDRLFPCLPILIGCWMNGMKKGRQFASW